MDVADSIVASFEVVYVHRGVAVHGIHEDWLCRASLKLCQSVVHVRASVVVVTDRSFVLISMCPFIVALTESDRQQVRRNMGKTVEPAFRNVPC